MKLATPRKVDVWGGIECTVNRLRDGWHSQLAIGGHDRRIEDLDAIAALGIRTLRYPILWELTAPDGQLEYARWAWADERLGRLRELEIEPIAGLVHHGSGPAHTNLLDPGFASGLAAYAGAVARRYPWLKRFTPVNEPLTTARFSALYGLWYPHQASDTAFLRALVNQCRAVVLSMQAIKAVIPDAELVQTEDLGRSYSTPLLTYQADYENERRWLTWDLLCGRIARTHPLWRYLRTHGIDARELDWFRDNACPPDILGINHYVTSNRYLDEHLDRYPPHYHGGNSRHAYADVEAVRALPGVPPGWREVIADAWNRYHLPIAITEVHLGCSRDEQMRWLIQAWHAANEAVKQGIDVKAITPWALLGSHDWSSLLTRFTGQYEAGAFDVRSPTPRRTALGELIRDLAQGHEPKSPRMIYAPGWWQRPVRFLPDYPSPDRGLPRVELGQEDGSGPTRLPIHAPLPSAPIVITGASGTLGRAFGRLCEQRGLPYRLLSRSQMDICDDGSIAQALDTLEPWAVINSAGYVRVDDAEDDRERCERENHAGPRGLAAECAARGLPFMTFSSDLVFGGERTEPYVETDTVSPLNVYGQSKARAEEAVVLVHPDALIVRTSAFFGPWDPYNFLAQALAALARGETIRAANDVTVSPTYVPDLVNACLDLLLDGERGLWHLTNGGSTSWVDFAKSAAQSAGIDGRTLQGVPLSALGWRASRPRYSAMTSSRGLVMPALDDAVGRFIAERRRALQRADAA